MATTTLQLKAKPGSSRSELVQEADGTWTAWLKSPPVDGKANAELIALVAKRFDDLAQILFDQAVLAEGGQLDDPAAYVRRVNAMLMA